MYLLDSNKYARDQNGVTAALKNIVEKCEGELLASRLWDERKLAYPIKGQRKGTYWLTFIRMESSRLTEFNREVQLNNQVLRHLVIKVDPRLVDTLVAHVRGEAAPAAAPEEKAETTAAAETSGEAKKP
jgi:small subunit ribosomal protein S6